MEGRIELAAAGCTASGLIGLGVESSEPVVASGCVMATAVPLGLEGGPTRPPNDDAIVKSTVSKGCGAIELFGVNLSSGAVIESRPEERSRLGFVLERCGVVGVGCFDPLSAPFAAAEAVFATAENSLLSFCS